MASKLKVFIGETLIYGFANVFSRVFAMLLIPLYASYLGKIDYSNLVMLQSVFAMLTFLLGLNSGVFYYYYEYENIRYRKMIFSSWFYYQIVIAAVLTITLFAFSGQLAMLFVPSDSNYNELVACVGLLGLQFFPYLVNNTNINLYRIDRKPKKVLYITLLEAVFTLAFIGVGLEYFSFGLTEIILAQIASRSIVSLFFVKTTQFYLALTDYSFSLLKKMFAFSWPFFVISIFQWLIIGADKFIGASALKDKEEVALLALAMQLALPIAVLADMIRMALGPFIMSIRKDEDADENYQRVFDLSVFTALLVLVALIVCTPWLVVFLADETYSNVLEVLPLIAMASVLSLIANQFAVSFSLVKRNIHILYAALLGGTTGFMINYLFMGAYGFIVSGYSQIISYLVIAVYLYAVGKKIANIQLKLKGSFKLLSIGTVFIVLLYFNLNAIYAQSKFYLVVVGGISILALGLVYLNMIKFKSFGSFRSHRNKK